MKIYEPIGKAREYAALALNPFKGCTHDCFYCYVKTMFGANNNQSIIIGYSEKSFNELINQIESSSFNKVVMLSFTTDIFCCLDLKFQALELIDYLINKGIKISILTKGDPTKFISDFKKYIGKIKIGSTLTFLEQDYNSEKAISSTERINILKNIKDNGITTWASFEPVISIIDTKFLIKRVVDESVCDYIKIGKINGIYDRGYDWVKFVTDCVNYLRLTEYRYKFYIKNDLAKFYRGEFIGNERNADYFNEII